jgi:uncharacterized protein YndB with AHSA1/START domain
MSGKARAGNSILGSLRSDESNGVAVRIEQRFDTEIDDLWSALTEPGRLARWYGEIEGDLRPGGEYRAHLFASGWQGTGRVEACEPARRLLVVSKDPELPNEDSVEVTLTTHGRQTVLVVEQWGIPLDMLPAYAAGLQIHVEDLADYLERRERREAAKARWDELIPAYQRLAADI